MHSSLILKKFYLSSTIKTHQHSARIILLTLATWSKELFYFLCFPGTDFPSGKSVNMVECKGMRSASLEVFKSCGDGELGMWFSGEHGMVRWVIGLSLRCLFQLEWCYDSMRFGEFHIAAPEKPTAVCGKEEMFSVASQVLSETWIMLLFRSDQITADHFFWLDSAPSLGFPGGACAQSLLLLVRRFPGSQCAVPREPPLSAACCSLLLWAVSIKILHLPCLRVSLSPLQRYFHITSACAWWSA